jgi:cytochrome P450
MGFEREYVLVSPGTPFPFRELDSNGLNLALRLYPVVPFNVRTANKDTCLPVGGGPDGTAPVFVPEGQEVLYSVYTMHRSPEIYGPDADEYRPERWANLKPGWAYIPFNGGPRICIGQQFALTEAGYTTVRLIQAFSSLESRDPNPFEESLALTLSSNNGTKVALTPI